jgi:hypothetical protein
MIIIFNKWIWRRPELLALNASKSPTISTLLLTTNTKTLLQACTATSIAAGQMGAYSIGLTIPLKLVCSNKNNKKAWISVSNV